VRFKAVSLFAITAVTAACGGNGAAPNIDPTAVLSAAPTLVQVGEQVAFDASGSSDADGFIQQYRFDFADASPEIATATPGAEHAFARAGVYEVRLYVVDDRGGEGTTTVEITVTDEPPPGGCTNDSQCQPNEHCTMGNCVPATMCDATTPCPSPLSCEFGFCRCPGTTQECGAACVDTNTDIANCGMCGNVCAPGDSCSGGTCHAPCPPGQMPCGTMCTDTTVDPSNCGMCGNVCGPGMKCQASMCIGMPCPPGQMLCPDGLCADTNSDPLNCGMCGNACGPMAICQMGTCVPFVCPGTEMFCPGVGCTNTLSDPLNCGMCGNVCMGMCVMGGCSVGGPPGSVIATYPPGPYPTVRGLTNVNGDWYFTTGRRFVQWDPTTGGEVGEWFIDNEPTRRDYGLAGKIGPMGEDDLFDGSYNRFGSPLMNVELDEYVAYSMHFANSPNHGGPAADDGAGHLWVFYNQTHTLYELDDSSFAVMATHPVTGLGMGDFFTDAALDGYGGLWLVSPQIMTPMGGVPAMMKKIDLMSGAMILDVPPPDPMGIGGIELVDGTLWGLGAMGAYQMVP
jgi:PKD repeat protein